MSSCKSIFVCTKGKTCSRRDADDLFKGIKKLVKKCELEESFEIKKSGCFGLCKHGPVIMVDGIAYGDGLEKSDYKRILKRHKKKSKPLKDLRIKK